MIKTTTRVVLLCALSVTMFATACKSKPKDTDTTTQTAPVSTDTTAATATPPPAAVVISPDDSLNNALKDAVKDFDGVTTSVSAGVVTLIGDINREKLPKLMMSVQALHPKKVVNNLTINK